MGALQVSRTRRDVVDRGTATMVFASRDRNTSIRRWVPQNLCVRAAEGVSRDRSELVRADLYDYSDIEAYFLMVEGTLQRGVVLFVRVRNGDETFRGFVRLRHMRHQAAPAGTSNAAGQMARLQHQSTAAKELQQS